MRIKKSELQKALNVVGKSIGGGFPVLDNVLLEVKETRLTLRTTNLVQITVYTLDIETEAGEGDWATAVPCKMLTDLVNNLDGEFVQVTCQPGTAGVEIACKTYNGKMRGRGIPSSEFPDFHPVKDSRFWAVDAVEFEQMIESVAFAASAAL